MQIVDTALMVRMMVGEQNTNNLQSSRGDGFDEDFSVTGIHDPAKV